MSKPPVNIKALLDAQGTDKGRWYGGLYGVLLSPVRECIRCVVEIGIGTVIPGGPSSMAGVGADNYRPGASLRAWRDFFPNADVHGVDVAPDTRIESEPRITTHFCDSSDPDQVATVLKAIAPPDLIIDDGLHVPSAQIATFRNFFPSLRAAGLYVLEDVIPANAPVILAEFNLIAPGCDVFVRRCELFLKGDIEGGSAIVVRKTMSKGAPECSIFGLERLREVEAKLNVTQGMLDSVYASRSWKVARSLSRLTAPIRALIRNG
jgi:hypothetical protein